MEKKIILGTPYEIVNPIFHMEKWRSSELHRNFLSYIFIWEKKLSYILSMGIFFLGTWYDFLSYNS